MTEFTASNGVTLHPHDSRMDVNCSGSAHPDGHKLSVKETEALREFFQHELDEERDMWRSSKDRTWTAMRRNNTIYFQNGDHERSFWFIVGNDATLKPWSGDLQAIAREYLEAHPERKPRAWADADVITWRDGAYLPQIAQKDRGRSNLGWRYSDETDARWCTEDELASLIGDADVTVLVAAADAS